MIARFVAPLGILMLLAGCVVSIEPFYQDEGVAFDSSLVGEWRVDTLSSGAPALQSFLRECVVRPGVWSWQDHDLVRVAAGKGIP